MTKPKNTLILHEITCTVSHIEELNTALAEAQRQIDQQTQIVVQSMAIKALKERTLAELKALIAPEPPKPEPPKPEPKPEPEFMQGMQEALAHGAVVAALSIADLERVRAERAGVAGVSLPHGPTPWAVSGLHDDDDKQIAQELRRLFDAAYNQGRPLKTSAMADGSRCPNVVWYVRVWLLRRFEVSGWVRRTRGYTYTNEYPRLGVAEKDYLWECAIKGVPDMWSPCLASNIKAHADRSPKLVKPVNRSNTTETT